MVTSRLIEGGATPDSLYSAKRGVGFRVLVIIRQE